MKGYEKPEKVQTRGGPWSMSKTLLHGMLHGRARLAMSGSLRLMVILHSARQQNRAPFSSSTHLGKGSFSPSSVGESLRIIRDQLGLTEIRAVQCRHYHYQLHEAVIAVCHTRLLCLGALC